MPTLASAQLADRRCPGTTAVNAGRPEPFDRIGREMSKFGLHAMLCGMELNQLQVWNLDRVRAHGSGADAPPDGLPLPAKRRVPDRLKGPEGPPLRARRLHMEYSMYKRFRDSAGKPLRRVQGVGIGRKTEPGRAKTEGFLADTTYWFASRRPENDLPANEGAEDDRGGKHESGG